MEIIKFVLGGMVGTGMITLSSYSCGKIFSKEFGEFKLLNKLLDRTFFGNNGLNVDSPLG